MAHAYPLQGCSLAHDHICVLIVCPGQLQQYRSSSLPLALPFSFLFLKYVSLDPDLGRLSWDFEFTAQSLRMSIVFQGTAL